MTAVSPTHHVSYMDHWSFSLFSLCFISPSCSSVHLTPTIITSDTLCSLTTCLLHRRRLRIALSSANVRPSSAAVFESLGDLAEEVIARPVSEASAFELTVVKSFEHHCGNPRYGYSTRAHGRRSDLLARVGEYLAGSVTSGQAVTVTQGDDGDARVRREGPTWWQTLQGNGIWARPAHAPC